MAYTKHTWKNTGETGAIPLSATNLNEMEDGIDSALRKDGGTMTGDLILSGNPTSDNMAANKKYIDESVISINQTFTITADGDSHLVGTISF